MPTAGSDELVAVAHAGCANVNHNILGRDVVWLVEIEHPNGPADLGDASGCMVFPVMSIGDEGGRVFLECKTPLQAARAPTQEKVQQADNSLSPVSARAFAGHHGAELREWVLVMR